VDGKVLTLRNLLIVRNVDGTEVARVERRLLALRPTYEVSVDGREIAEVRKHLFTFLHDRFTIDIPGDEDLAMDGDIFDHEFTIRQAERVVAAVSKRWIAMTDTYGVDIEPGQDDLLILACVLALDLAIDQERAGDQ
jgi:uncharacterized protein YxjI